VALAAAIVGLGFVIFVHELGHFLVAKACGVKCEKFYLGFDIYGLRLFRFRRGETEYGIGILPLGGYVKMLGQEDNPVRLREEMERAKVKPEGDAQGSAKPEDLAAAEHAQQVLYDPRSYLAKSVPRRMAIISAGVIMNLIFALLMAIAAFGFGVRQIAAGVGQAIPGKGAWTAGLRAGDKIIKIAGKEIETFDDMREAVMLGDIEHGLEVVVERPGVGESTFTIRVGEIAGNPGIGVRPPWETSLLDEEGALPVVPGSPAAESKPAFQPGDRVLKIAVDNGDKQPVEAQTIENYGQLASYLELHPDRPLVLAIEREKELDTMSENPPPPQQLAIRLAANPVRSFGLVMKIGPITAVQAGSPAEKAGIKPGDVIRTLDGQPVDDPLRLPDRLRQNARKTVKIGIERAGKTIDIPVTLRPADQSDMPMNQDDPMGASALGVAYRVLNEVESVEKNSVAEDKGLRKGDILVSATIHPPDREAIKAMREQYRQPELGQARVTIQFDDEHRNWPYLMMYLMQSAEPGAALPGSQLQLKWQRDKDVHEVYVALSPVAGWFNPDRGLIFEPVMVRQQGDAVRLGAKATVNSTLMVYRMLQKVGSGQISARNFGGPWTIIRVAIATALQGPGRFLLFLTLLSANLAVLNFLPIPVLDGGHMVFLAYEGIRGKPANERVQMTLTLIGFALLMALMVWVFGLDFGLIARPGQ
jgi:regulator of sigma E protease